MNDTSIVIKTELYQKYNKKITKYRIYKCSYNYDSNNDIINITNIEVIDE
jgi:ribosomal protein S17